MKESKKNLSFPSINNCISNRRRGSQMLVCDMKALLRSQSFFPYFMLVAFEGGSMLRALLLLLSYPLLCVLDFETELRVMIFISFCGLRLKDMDVVARAVLPKFYLENLNLLVYEVFESVGKKLVLTSLPRVMVESFLKGYLSVDMVKGTELHTIGPFFTGFVSSSGLLVKHKALQQFCGENMPHIGIGSQNDDHHHQFLSHFKEAYVVRTEDLKSNSTKSVIMPRERYPKPLIFHDGRLAFFPTPLATTEMFIWLPFGIILATFRILIAAILPYRLAALLMACTGVKFDFKGKSVHNYHRKSKSKSKSCGVLYVCNHRTLVDPAVLLAALDKKPLTVVTYGLSKFSALIAPIRTVSLRRDRTQDAKTIQKLLSEGDLVVCPEGTTCREPYLLRFSSLFAELTNEIVPVAISTSVTTFYGTTASGFKWLDPIYMAMNLRLSYSVEVLEKLPKELTVSGGKSSHEVANFVQRKIADALGLECTSLTRKDKYMMLVGNEGLVQHSCTRIIMH
ncbi:OLC1v1023536C1 [Oldenlandia corymbosa var. corymbosa]|uniref:OLC1v1023536C1 n=1 Tax=Oldenlandia corymbosa var. corymbosa TaxID=529605 RepID=A0AAV1C121_OLDCO|nr:OLC1v1023536C1 [Oldenlandia corymbosa var. corymbosa]